MKLPDSIFPDSKLNFSKFTSIAYSSTFIYPLKFHSYLCPTSRLCCIFPPTGSFIQDYVMNQKDYYYHRKYAGEYVDSELLMDESKPEELNFQGNCLYTFIRNELVYLCKTYGVTGNLLQVYELADVESTFMANGIVYEMEFQLPILQITGNDKILAIRTMQGIHQVEVYHLFEQESRISASRRWITSTFGKEPVHVAFNFKLSHSAVLTSDNTLYMTDLKTNKFQKQTEKYHKCEYATHPLTLYGSTSESLYLYDTRTKKSNSMYTVNEKIHDIASLGRLYHSVITTATDCVLLDERYLKTPILRWNLNNQHEQWQHVSSIGNGFLVWGEQTHEILLYRYEKHDIDEIINYPTAKKYQSREERESTLPYCSWNTCMATPYHYHDFIRKSDPSMYGKIILDWQTIHTYYETAKPCNRLANVTGVVPVLSDTRLIIYQQVNGAVFCRGYKYTKEPFHATEDEDMFNDWEREVCNKFRENVKICTDEEANHEIIDVEKYMNDLVLDIVNNKGIVNDDDETWQEKLGYDYLNTVYDQLDKFGDKITYNGDQAIIPNASYSIDQVESIIDHVEADMPSTSKILELSSFNGNFRQLISKFIPSEHDFSHELTTIARRRIEADVSLANILIFPNNRRYEVSVPGDHNEHESIIESPLYTKGKLELKGLSSWLCENWDNEEELYGGYSDVESVHSSERGRSLTRGKRKSEMSVSVGSARSRTTQGRTPQSSTERVETWTPVIQSATQPIIQSASTRLKNTVISSSLPNPEPKSKITKRRKGF